jgi:integrase
MSGCRSVPIPRSALPRVHKQKRLTRRWSRAVIEKFSETANEVVRLGFYLLLYTAQRESDVVTMKWQDIDWQHGDGPRIRVKQRKTGEVVWIPLASELRTILEQTPRVNDHILNSEKGTPFTDATGFAKAIRRTLKEIGVEDHSGHGLRVTAACNLKEAGCTDDQVMAVTGHTETKTLRKYLREVEREVLARQAMAKREAAGRY